MLPKCYQIFRDLDEIGIQNDILKTLLASEKHMQALEEIDVTKDAAVFWEARWLNEVLSCYQSCVIRKMWKRNGFDLFICVSLLR